MALNAPPGVFDIIPEASAEQWRSSYLWTHIEKTARHIASVFGYKEIRTPIFERKELFQRGVGDNTDIVSKEMYTFEDRGSRAMALRPEGTAAVIRAYLENRLEQMPGQQKLFYLAPMFRYERAQAGRYRQHHQFGVEAFGVGTPAQDAEVIDMLFCFYKNLGLKNLHLHINTLGDPAGRKAYKESLVDYLQKFKEALSKDSQTRLEFNPLRILDSKDPNDQEILKQAPTLFDYLSADSLKYFEKVCSLLSSIGIDHSVSPKLVRGLDYYNGTVFEVTSQALGAQNSIGGGGRYDGLVKLLGGPELPSIGWGTGLERIIQTMIAQEVAPSAPSGPKIFLVPLGENSYDFCFKLLHRLHENGIAAQMELGNRKLAKSMQHANAIQAAYTAVVGDNELESGSLQIKNMSTGHQDSVAIDRLEAYLSGGIS